MQQKKVIVSNVRKCRPSSHLLQKSSYNRNALEEKVVQLQNSLQEFRRMLLNTNQERDNIEFVTPLFSELQEKRWKDFYRSAFRSIIDIQSKGFKKYSKELQKMNNSAVVQKLSDISKRTFMCASLCGLTTAFKVDEIEYNKPDVDSSTVDSSIEICTSEWDTDVADRLQPEVVSRDLETLAHKNLFKLKGQNKALKYRRNASYTVIAPLAQNLKEAENSDKHTQVRSFPVDASELPVEHLPGGRSIQCISDTLSSKVFRVKRDGYVTNLRMLDVDTYAQKSELTAKHKEKEEADFDSYASHLGEIFERLCTLEKKVGYTQELAKRIMAEHVNVSKKKEDSLKAAVSSACEAIASFEKFNATDSVPLEDDIATTNFGLEKGHPKNQGLREALSVNEMVQQHREDFWNSLVEKGFLKAEYVQSRSLEGSSVSVAPALPDSSIEGAAEDEADGTSNCHIDKVNQSVDDHSGNDQYSNAKSVDDQYSNARSVDGHSSNARSVHDQSSNAPSVDDHSTDAQSVDDQYSYAHSIDDHSSNAQSVDDHSSNAQSVDDHSSNAQSVDDHSSNSPSVDDHSTDAQSSDAQSVEEKYADKSDQSSCNDNI